MLEEKEGIILSSSSGVLDVSIARIDRTKVLLDVDFQEAINDITGTEDYLLIIDKNVYDLHEGRFIGYKSLRLDAGDANKNQSSIDRIIDAAIKNGVSRAGYFIAIGGGTITDMVGFAANNYFRGIRYVNIPTSLLGMVDAAVGGKTAINHKHQKNMVGSFYHPARIIYDFSFLETLDKRNFINGYGEIIKVAILSNEPIFDRLEQLKGEYLAINQNLKDIICLTVQQKLIMLGENCFERDLRRPLNLGHTTAHPIEDITEFQIYHGEAVALGCLFACSIAKQQRKLAVSTVSRIKFLIEDSNILMFAKNITVDRELLWERLQRLIMQRGGKGLLYVIPTGIGSCEIVQNISKEEFNIAFEEVFGY